MRVKKFNQNLPENYSKSTKIAITACKFSKIFPGEDAIRPFRAVVLKLGIAVSLGSTKQFQGDREEVADF